MKGRVREFNNARDKNLTEAYSYMSKSSVMGSNSYQKASVNLSASSLFNKSQKPQVCTICVNKKIVQKNSEKRNVQKQNQLNECHLLNEQVKNYRDTARDFRKKMLKEAEEYNKKIIQSRPFEFKTKKEEQSKLMNDLCFKQKSLIEQEKKRNDQQKLKQLRYRQSLYLQCQDNINKKKQIQKQLQKTQINMIPFKKNQRDDLKKNYIQDLKKQIIADKRKKEQIKQLEKNQEKSEVQYCEKSFQKFTQFSETMIRKHEINPQIFDDIKLMQYSRKNSKIDQRESKRLERQQQLLKQKEDNLLKMQKIKKQTHQYEMFLQKQIKQKKIMQESMKLQDKMFVEKIDLTQDIAKSRHLKSCQDCHLSCDERSLSYFE